MDPDDREAVALVRLAGCSDGEAARARRRPRGAPRRAGLRAVAAATLLAEQPSERAANAAASARLRKRSFSSTWRTWVLTVASLTNSRSAISRLRRPSAMQREHLALALAERPRAVRRPCARAAELGEHAPGHRGGDPRLAAPGPSTASDQLLRRHVLEQVAGGADAQRGVEVGARARTR